MMLQWGSTATMSGASFTSCSAKVSHRVTHHTYTIHTSHTCWGRIASTPPLLADPHRRHRLITSYNHPITLLVIIIIIVTTYPTHR